MYYRISKNEKNLFFGKKNRPGVGSDLKCKLHVSYGLYVCTNPRALASGLNPAHTHSHAITALLHQHASALCAL